jgi:SOS-response transcriptional repressor LexA
MPNDIPSRLLALRKRLRYSMKDMAQAIGFAQGSSWQRYESPDQKDRKGLPVDLVEKMISALVGRGDPPIKKDELLALTGFHTVTQDVKPLTKLPGNSLHVTTVTVLGSVQAGLWQTAFEWSTGERYNVPSVLHPSYHTLPLFGLEVKGASMDDVYPHGSIIICVKFLDLGRSPRSGERVVAIATREDDMVEATVKEYRIGADGLPRLWPRSTHPDFQQPLLIKAGSERELTILALVIGSYRPEA